MQLMYARNRMAKTRYFLRRGMQIQMPISLLCLNMHDRTRIIDAPSFTVCVEDAIQSQWRNGVQNKREYYGSTECKLSGNPWFPCGSQTVYSRILLYQILANVQEKGYKLYASVDISTGQDGVNLESWIFRQALLGVKFRSYRNNSCILTQF